MEFENEFSVKAPIDEVYATLMDLEHASDDAYKVGIKVKLGPVTMNYRGDVEVVARDPAGHTATMSVKAKEARGQGTATADVALNLSEQGEETHAKLDTNLHLSGKAAAMGQGVIENVSAKLVDQFAYNLACMLEGRPAEEAAAAVAGNGGASATPSTPESPPPAPAREAAPPSEDLDALALAASVAADRMRDPRVLLGSLAAAALAGYLLGRRARGR